MGENYMKSILGREIFLETGGNLFFSSFFFAAANFWRRGSQINLNDTIANGLRLLRLLHGFRLLQPVPRSFEQRKATALWARITKNTDWSNGPLARLFVRLLAPLTLLTPFLVGK